jgi:hypothetical protein
MAGQYHVSVCRLAVAIRGDRPVFFPPLTLQRAWQREYPSFSALSLSLSLSLSPSPPLPLRFPRSFRQTRAASWSPTSFLTLAEISRVRQQPVIAPRYELRLRRRNAPIVIDNIEISLLSRYESTGGAQEKRRAGQGGGAESAARAERRGDTARAPPPAAPPFTLHPVPLSRCAPRAIDIPLSSVSL